MKFQLSLFSLFSALCFCLLAFSLPLPLPLPLPGRVFPFPDLPAPAAPKPNENDLFLSRWQTNFGHRLTKPEAPILPKPAAPIFVLPTNIYPAKTKPPARLSAAPDFDARKLYDFPLRPEDPPVYPPVMHGALGFLKPALAASVASVALVESLQSSSSGSSAGSDDDYDYGYDSDAVSFSTLSLPGVLTPPEPKKQVWDMPPNTMTVADLARGILAEAQAKADRGCPGCGADVHVRNSAGWGSRFSAWVKELWERIFGLVTPAHI